MTDSPIISAFITVIVALLFLGGLSLFLKKLGNVTGNNSISKNIKLLSKTPISPKHYLVSVLIGNRILILGIAESSVNIITEITHPDEVRSYLQDLPTDSIQDFSLSKIISNFIGTRKSS